MRIYIYIQHTHIYIHIYIYTHQVSYAPEIKAHTEIDPGSDLRLRAAAHGNLKAFSRRIGSGSAELQEEAARLVYTHICAQILGKIWYL